MSYYRIENKEDVRYNGKKTAFDVFVYSEGANAYLFEGRYFANGYSATDGKCINQYNKELALEEELQCLDTY